MNTRPDKNSDPPLIPSETRDAELLSFQCFAERHPDAVCVVDLTGRIIQVNAAAEAMLTVGTADLLGQYLPLLFPHDEQRSVATTLLHTLQGASHKGDSVMVRPNGERVHVSLTYTPAMAGGRVVAAFVVAADVTAQITANRRLIESYGWMQALFDHAPSAFWVKDLSGRYLLINRAFEQGLGTSQEQAFGRSDHELFAKPIADQFVANDQIVLESGRPQYLEEAVPVEDEIPTAIALKFLFRDSAGLPQAICGISTDITARTQVEHQLQESEERYRSLFENNPNFVGAFDLYGHLLRANPAAETMSGYPQSALLGLAYLELLSGSDLPQITELSQWREDGPTRFESFLCHRKGWKVYMDCTAFPTMVNGQVAGFYVMAEDITEQKRIESGQAFLARAGTVLASSLDYRTTLGQVADLAVEYVADWCCIYGFNLDGSLTELGFAHVDPSKRDSVRSQLAVQTDEQFFALNADDPAYVEHMSRLGMRSSIAVPMTVNGKVTGLMILALSDSFRNYGPSDQGIAEELARRAALAIENARLYEETRYAADHDAMTGLANRSLLLSHLTQVYERNPLEGGFAVLCLDMDRFKVVNDSLGHGVGDVLLVEVARRLEGCVGAEDLVARLGGDEFTILINNVSSKTDAMSLATHVLTTLQAPLDIDGHRLFVNSSVGVVFGDQALSPKEALRMGDIAMYKAKAMGKGRCALFEPAMDQGERGLQLELTLHRALTESEFRLDYQPVVDLMTGDIVALESLIRWHHPIRGVIPPATFIPLAEETGLIVPIGQWVLKEACSEARRWADRSAGQRPVRVNVNLSAKEIFVPDFTQLVARILAETELDPCLLQLEITESVLIEDAMTLRATLLALKALGVSVALDDFGAGYSSLQYLKDFPVDVLKIDRSFISDLGEDRAGYALVETVLSLAKALNLVVVAEGVETEQHLTALRSMGCHEGQGYFFSPPVAAEAVNDTIGRLREVSKAQRYSRRCNDG